MKVQERISSFDKLRSIAIFGVVFIHANSVAYRGAAYDMNLYLSLILKQIVIFSVPLFLFISGYFLANKEINTLSEYTAFLKKQLPRVLIPFVIWSIAYSIQNYLSTHDLKYTIKSFVTFQASMPFYYIFLIVQYYILQPVIRYLGENFSRLAISLIISLICCQIFEILRYTYKVEVPVIVAGNFLTWLIFPVLGVYASKQSLMLKPTPVLAISMVLLIASIAHAVYLAISYKQPAYAGTAVKTTSFLYSVSIILFLFSIRERLFNSSLLTKIGLLSFGIYFVHMFVLDAIQYILAKTSPIQFQQNFAIQILTAILVVLVSYYLGVVFRKINNDKARKYLGY